MSNTLHIITKRVIEYGGSDFNWQIEPLEDLFRDCGCCVVGTLNEDGIGDWEIEETEFQQAVRKVEAMDAAKLKSFFYTDYVGEETDEQFKNEVVQMLREFEQTGDHLSGYYHFSWF